MDVLSQQFAAFKPAIHRLERQILAYMSIGWVPSSGFDKNGRSTFDVARDIDRIPTRSWPFTKLEDAVVPLFFYILLIIFGTVLFSVRSKRNTNSLIPSSWLYPIKFAYNFAQIFLCAYMAMESVALVYRHNLSVFPLTPSLCSSFSFADPKLGALLWLFYVSKVLDFADTAFIVLGGKGAQFSFLHAYHHITIFAVYWLNVNLNYDGGIYFTIFANAIVHTLMYTYYLISMHIPKEKDARTGRAKYGVWWKKYLTLFQLAQFVTMNAQAILFFVNGCVANPPRVTMLYLVYIMSLFAMFMDFFCKSYGSRAPKVHANPRTKKNKKNL